MISASGIDRNLAGFTAAGEPHVRNQHELLADERLHAVNVSRKFKEDWRGKLSTLPSSWRRCWPSSMPGYLSSLPTSRTLAGFLK